ncbi:MAG: TMEM143 family protein [Planctomycetota bacterium]
MERTQDRQNRSTHPGTREHYIPLRRQDLQDTLLNELTTTEEDRQRLQQICRLLEDTFHVLQYRKFLRIMESYAPFDPDTDTFPQHSHSEQQLQQLAPTVCDQIVQLLREANFRRLERQDLEAAVRHAGDFGLKLKVDFDRFEQLEVFVRGDAQVRKNRRRLRKLYRSESTEVAVYRRLAIVFRLKPTATAQDLDWHDIHVKLFKDIPKSDIEMLLPGVYVEMSWLDRGRIILPTMSGLGLTLYKLAKGAVAIAFVGIYGLIGFLGLVGGVLGYGFKSLMGYLNTKDKYQLRLTRSLYYQNLDNNAGAIFRLLAEAEEQELREVLLGYFLLWRDAGHDGWTPQQLDGAAEEFLAETVGESIDFEIGDALQKLERLQLVEPRLGGRWRAVPLDQAWTQLRSRWNDFVRSENVIVDDLLGQETKNGSTRSSDHVSRD